MMKSKRNYLVVCFCCMAMLITGITGGGRRTRAASDVPEITYSAHVQNIGWMGSVKNGQTAGTTGKSLRLEALKINLKSGTKSMIQYRGHVEGIGWQSWTSSGNISGTVGKGYRMEAIQIKILSDYADKYDIYYRVHVPNFGWLGYAKNGETAGSTGFSQRIEAIQIRLITKNQSFQTNGSPVIAKPVLTYQAHSQNIGWMKSVSENSVAGTTGRSYRLEALKINIGSGGVSYRAHVANVGWQGWKSTGQVMGTTGQGNAIEAVEIKLTGSLSNYYDIYYRMHVAGIGWLGWAKNGEKAGTTGGSISSEAIQIQIVLKDQAFNRQGTAYYDKSGSVSNTVQSGYDSKVSSFLSTAKWKNGAVWNSSKRPTIGNGSGTGCYSYANDFIKYVFGASGSFANTGTAFYSPSSIRNGDVIKVVGSEHWFVVLYRNGNRLTTAEGNWLGKVVISDTAYSLSGNTLCRSGKKFRTFSVGYHYQ